MVNSIAAVRVLVVEDNPQFLEYFVSFIDRHTDMDLVGRAEDGATAVRIAESLRPDLILMDIALPALSGFDAARQISRVSPESKIVFVTQQSSRDFLEEAFSVGAQAYVLKVRVEKDLLAALENVCHGEKFVSPGLQWDDLRVVN